MIIFLLLLNLILILLTAFSLGRMLERLDKKLEWLCEEVFVKNPNSTMPPNIKIESKKAEVYIPGKDPMSEFNGTRSDFHA